jgi:hypothetical protein
MPKPRTAKVWLFLADDGELVVHQQLYSIGPYTLCQEDYNATCTQYARAFEQADGTEYLLLVHPEVEVADLVTSLGHGWHLADLTPFKEKDFAFGADPGLV